MKLIHEVIADCFQCPYMTDMNSIDMDGGGKGQFDFCCAKTKDYPTIVSSEDKSRVKREWREGSLIRMEIEIPDWCPLPYKEE